MQMTGPPPNLHVSRYPGNSALGVQVLLEKRLGTLPKTSTLSKEKPCWGT